MALLLLNDNKYILTSKASLTLTYRSLGYSSLWSELDVLRVFLHSIFKVKVNLNSVKMIYRVSQIKLEMTSFYNL